jgi:hypothetical protein
VDAAAVERRIRERAYHLWRQRAAGVGDDAEGDWLNAELIERGR